LGPRRFLLIIFNGGDWFLFLQPVPHLAARARESTITIAPQRLTGHAFSLLNRVLSKVSKWVFERITRL
jgi:hypothetical protein